MFSAALLVTTTSAWANEPRRLSLIVSSGLDGQIAVPDCRGGHPAGRTIAHLAASLTEAKKTAADSGRTVVGAVHLGDFTGPGVLSRYLQVQPDGPGRLAGMFRDSAFTSGVLGKHWFDQPADILNSIASTFPAKGGPVLLSANVSCAGRADCKAIEAMPARSVIDLGGASLTLIGATDDSVLSAIDPAVSKGLSIAPAAGAIQAESADARQKGVQLVIAAISFDGSHGTPPYLDQVSEILPNVDLVVINQLGRFRQATTVIANQEGPTVVVAGATPTEVVQIDFDAIPAEGRWKVADVRARRVAAIQPDAALEGKVQTLHQEYCAAWSQKLPVVADPPVDKDTFLTELLETMRTAARTEVAFANERAVASDVFPFSGSLARADVFAALRYEDSILKGSIPGATLAALWATDVERKNSGRAGLAWLGVEVKGDALWVNGRVLDESANYTVVVPDFLARGGDGWITDSTPFKPVMSAGKSQRLTELMLNELSSAPEGTPFAKLDHPDLSKRLRWTWSSVLTLTISDLRGAHQAVYNDSRLLRPSSTVFGGDLSGVVEGSQVDHEMRISARGRYYAAAVDAQSFKLDDGAFVEALYGLKTIRRLLDERWFAPVPYAAATLDSEFAPTNGERYRQLELGGALGVRFGVARPLEIKVAFAGRRELLDPQGRTRRGLGLGDDLPRFSSLRILQTPIDLESSLDYFVAPDGGQVFQEGRVRARLLVPLIGPLGFSAGFDMFLFQASSGPVGLLMETTAGLTIRADGSHQQFSDHRHS
jgi:2',3'-cyclic-nucleotide 2'-phosphodiesterase (5'-nucleotidase family)